MATKASNELCWGACLAVDSHGLKTVIMADDKLPSTLRVRALLEGSQQIKLQNFNSQNDLKSTRNDRDTTAASKAVPYKQGCPFPLDLDCHLWVYRNSQDFDSAWPNWGETENTECQTMFLKQGLNSKYAVKIMTQTIDNAKTRLPLQPTCGKVNPRRRETQVGMFSCLWQISIEWLHATTESWPELTVITLTTGLNRPTNSSLAWLVKPSYPSKSTHVLSSLTS